MEAGRRFIKLESLKREIKLELKDSMRCRRDRFQRLSDPLGYVFADPPWLAEQLAWTVDDEKDEINDLICRIKNGVCEMKNGFHKGKIKKKQNKFVEECTKEIQVCTKELSEMITADPRLCDLLGRDSLELIVSLLRHEHEHSEKLQTHAAIILRSVVTFSRNKNEVGVVIKNITPVVFRLIRSPDFWVQVEALWLLRNLIYKISKSSIEQALSPIISIILKNSNDNKVLQAAFEVLKAVCEEHPKLSCEQLKLVVQALMKLIESNSSRQIFAGCLGLALLCDGREEMVVEEKDFETLICRLVLFMNSADCGEIIHGLICLGSIVRWGDDDAIQVDLVSGLLLVQSYAHSFSGNTHQIYMSVQTPTNELEWLNGRLQIWSMWYTSHLLCLYDLMETKGGKKKSSCTIFYEAPLGYSIEDVRPHGGIMKFKSAAYSNFARKPF